LAIHSIQPWSNLLVGLTATFRTGESLPDILNVGFSVIQPFCRDDFVPPTAGLAMKTKRHAGFSEV
jgi:hypothetical protein